MLKLWLGEILRYDISSEFPRVRLARVQSRYGLSDLGFLLPRPVRRLGSWIADRAAVEK